MSFYGNKKPSSMEELKKRVKENKLGGVYLFWGAEEYTKDFYADKLRKLAQSSPVPEFNYEIFDAETRSVGDFEEATFALPYLWENRVIEIRNLKPKKVYLSEAEEYARIFETLPDYLTVLILLRAGDYNGSKAGSDAPKEEKNEEDKPEEKKNGFKTFLAAVEANGLSVEFEPEKGEKLCNWISRHFASRGVKTAPGVPSFMASYCGTDMYTLQGEIQKLCDACGGKAVTEQDVRSYCSANENHVFFDVANCMVRGDLPGARRILAGLKMTPDAVPMAMGFLASNYRLMLLVKAGMDMGKSAAQIATEHKITTWKVSKIASSLGYVDYAALQFAITEIAEADAKMKTRRGNTAAALETLVYRICMYGK